LYNFLYSPAFPTCKIPQASKRTVLFHDSSRNVRYEKFPVSVYRKKYTDIIGIPVFLW
jgi:hypothetical protein